MIEIGDLRVTFLWVDTIPALLDGEVPPKSPMAFLAGEQSYSDAFLQCLLEPGEGALTPPWLRPKGQWFWTYYLEQQTPGAIDGGAAWRALVPFRGIVSGVTAPALPIQLYLEAFYYPHAIALGVTAMFRTPLPLEDVVDKALALRRDAVFEVDGQDTGKPVNLNALARQALDLIRVEAFGDEVASKPDEPFSVATVVRGAGVDSAAATAQGGPAHRALAALTGWRPTWRLDVLPPLTEFQIPSRTAPASHVLYGSKRGRAVWYPDRFSSSTSTLRSLSCLHRNLVFASLQVESLARLALDSEAVRQAGKVLLGNRRNLSRRAVGILGRMYGGDKSTYRSWSPRRQMEQNDYVAPVNSLRKYFDQPPLH